MNIMSLKFLMLLGCLVVSATGCFDWTVPAGARLTCSEVATDGQSGPDVGCPDGWTCDGTQCVSLSCGNGETDPGEECDNANANNDELTGPSICRTNCRRPHCGDGVIDEGEACDDGVDGDQLDGCSDYCLRIGSCGDGKVQAAVETCDDGNQISGDGCSSDYISEEGFVLVRGGTVSMDGVDDAEAWPPVEFELKHDFVMQAHEVTQAQWLEVMGGFRGDGPHFPDCSECPIESVSWFDALAYCNKRSRQEGLKPCYGIEPAQELFAEAQIQFSGLECTGYRLPLEAEWEYAVRGGTPQDEARYHGGGGSADTVHAGGCLTNVALENSGWHCANSWQDPLNMWSTDESHIHIVKQKDPNALGLYDMLGNVWEWVWDHWQPLGDYERLSADWTVQGPAEGADRVKRGGGYFDSANQCTMGSRQPHSPNARDKSIGFRVVRTLPMGGAK